MNDQMLPSIVCTAMMRLGTRMAAEFDQHFARFGLTQAQFRTLLTICEDGEEGVTPSALAERLLIKRATVSVLTNRMVERGWLERVPGENRRTFRLILTALGGQTLQTIVPHAIAVADATLSGIAPEDLRRMQAGLETLEARLRACETPGPKEGREEGAD